MRMRAPGCWHVLFGCLVIAVGSALKLDCAADCSSEAVPRLAVLLYFDQLRGDYLTRWDALFDEGGFHRLEHDGAWFQNCHYPYSYTVTAAGHASVATGCSPHGHGIIGNEWYDRSSGATVNCVGSDRYERVPPATSAVRESESSSQEGDKEPAKKRPKGIAPERLLQPTIADALKLATKGRSRVVALSFKDRSAVLPGGRQPDACYWLDSTTGQFVTSTYYRESLHRWVADYNAQKSADQWFGKEWTRLRPEQEYLRWSGPDDVDGEGKGSSQGRIFPHPFDGGPKKLLTTYYSALYNSPFGNDLLLGLVKKAIDAEQLGSHETPDLLTVSFSCNDPIGHCWGPDSQEVMDVTLRSDLIVKDLLSYLDAKVGRGRYWVVLTADHGVCPLPEVARSHGKDAARIPPAVLGTKAVEFLDAKFGKNEETVRWMEATTGPWIYLNRATIQRHGLSYADVESALAAWLRQQIGIEAVYTRTQLAQGIPPDDVIGQAVMRSFYPERSGDLVVIQKPYHLITASLTGTTHGTPHEYDTHVPLLVYGPGVKGGVRQEPVTPQAAASILAQLLHILPPAAAEAAVPRPLADSD